MKQFKEMSAEELYEKLKNVKGGAPTALYTLQKCREILPLVNKINRLKVEKNIAILAHYYVTPDIIYGVADYVGDSYKLSKDAQSADCDGIIFAAVKFMGETAKILNPGKDVLVPGDDPACTLADAVKAEDVRELRKKYPEHTFMCYINTNADVKAQCDVCVTSSNVYNIVEKYPSDRIVFVPDKLMGQNVINYLKEKGIEKDIVLFEGSCYVHEEFDPATIDSVRAKVKDVTVLAHPECKPEVASKADYVGSTGQMISYIEKCEHKTFLMLTECGLGASLEVEHPELNFIATCKLCKYMKTNTLENILKTLESPKPEQYVTVDRTIADKALDCINQMFVYAEK